MIQMPPSTVSVNAFAPHEPSDQADVLDPVTEPVLGDGDAKSGDALARFGAMNGFHASTQQFAYASPNGGGGGSGGRGANASPAKAGGAPANAPGTSSNLAEARQVMERGIKLLNQHRYADAIAAFEEGFRLHPDPAFLLNKAAALRDAGRYAEAVMAYENYLSDPQAPRADEAREAMESARSKLGGREPTMTGVVESEKLFTAGVRAYQAGRYDEALEAFEKAFELNPRADLKYNQAACLDKLGRRNAAADRYEAYVLFDPKAADTPKVLARVEKLRTEANTMPITQGGRAGAMEWMSRGNQLIREHRYNEAVAAFEEGFRTYPDAKFLLNKASALLDAGRYAEADLAYQVYLDGTDAPRADEARVAQQRARAQMGGREATYAGLEQAKTYFQQGTDHYKAGRYSDALKAFERVAQLNPRAEVFYNQAACLDKLGRREEAIAKYQQYLTMAPDASDAGKVKTRIGQLQEQMMTLAREAFDRGQAAFSKGNYRDAAIAFGEAYQHKALPQFLYNVATSLDKAGDTEQAVRAYQRYLAASPDAADAGKVRTRIEQLNNATGNGLMKPGA